MTVSLLWSLPFGLQGLAMGLDEFVFHRRRTPPRLERLGHILDTGVFLACLAVALLAAPTSHNLRLYGWVAVLSCVLITKDEFLHQRLCGGGEHWLHAVLFILHPLVLVGTALFWISLGPTALSAFPAPTLPWAGRWLLLQVILVSGFLVVQFAQGWRRTPTVESAPGIDNSIYDHLGDRWYEAQDDPVALLRAESRLRTDWVLDELEDLAGDAPLAVLDIACGAGFLSNPLAAAGYRVTGVDLSEHSLAVARRHDSTGAVTYLPMDARNLALPDGHFDAVCMMDFLEHLPERDAVLREAARVLRPGGLFLFHTFNRNPLAWLIAIKGVEWFVANTPKRMHVYELFLKPHELRDLCARHDLQIERYRGLRPRLFSRPFLQLLVTGRVNDHFQFLFTQCLALGYCGRARKTTAAPHERSSLPTQRTKEFRHG